MHAVHDRTVGGPNDGVTQLRFVDEPAMRREIDRSQIWSSKQGLFLYSTGQDSPKVAKALQDYAKAVTGHRN